MQVQFFDKGTNLHRLWDSDMIERYNTSEDAWLAELATLATPENQKAWTTGTVEDWATESLLAARAAYLVPTTDKRLKPGEKLGAEYMEANLPIVSPAALPSRRQVGVGSQ